MLAVVSDHGLIKMAKGYSKEPALLVSCWYVSRRACSPVLTSTAFSALHVLATFGMGEETMGRGCLA